MPPIQKLLVFLASPSDVPTERRHVAEVLTELNRTVASAKDVILQLVSWENDAFPGYGMDAQALLNTQIAEMEKYTLFVGIMWNRIGTPTSRAPSGTVEEFERAMAALARSGQPQIWFYFREAAANLDTQEKLEQRGKVLEFRKRIQTNGLPWTYKTPSDFRTQFRNQLALWLNARPSPLTERVDSTQNAGETISSTAGSMPVQSGGSTDSLVRLVELQELLDESLVLFRKQQSLVEQLDALLAEKLGDRMPQDIGYDETFFRLYEDMDAGQKELFSLIRGMTASSVHRVNGQIREWAKVHPLSQLGLGDLKKAKRFQKQLNQLRGHLDLWFDRYESKFLTSDRRSIIYLDDLSIPGTSFPTGIDRTVRDLIFEVRNRISGEAKMELRPSSNGVAQNKKS